MAKKTEPASIMDMFSKLGHDLKMPHVDVEAILSHHRKNFEALEAAARTSAQGATSLMNRQREMLQRTLHEVANMSQGFRTPGNPQDLMARQAEFAKKSFEAAVADASEVASLVNKTSTDAIEILRSRIRESMEEIQENFDKHK